MLPLNLWFWISVSIILFIYIFLLKKINEMETERIIEFIFGLNKQENLNIIRSKQNEIIGWFFMVVGFIMLTYSILNFFLRESLFVTILGSGFVIGGYILASHYRRSRKIKLNVIEE